MLGQPIGIPDPAVDDEVTDGRSWWKVCCLGCCLGFLVLFVLIVVGIRFLSGPGPKSVSGLPAGYPAVLVFRPEEAAQILYYSGASKSSLSRLVATPVAWLVGLSGGSSSSTGALASLDMQLRGLQGRDTVTVQWENLNASRDEVLRFYTGALRQAGVSSPKTTDPNGTWDVHMTGRNATLSFNLLIQDDPDKPAIDRLTVVTEYPVPSAGQ